MCLVPKLNYNSALTYYSRMGMWGLVLGTREPIIAMDINLRHCSVLLHCHCTVGSKADITLNITVTAQKQFQGLQGLPQGWYICFWESFGPIPA